MSDLHFHSQAPGSEDHYMREQHASFAPQTPEVYVFITTVGPESIVDGYIQYRDQVKIRVDVERCGSRFKELVLLDPYSMQPPGNYQLGPSQLLLTGAAFCALCTTTQDAEIGRRCRPHTFSLPPCKEGVLLSFDDSNTRYSQVAAFEIPFRYRKPGHGQPSRCDSESLIISFALNDPYGNVATFQMPTPLRARKHQKTLPHQATVQPQHVPVQPQHVPVQPQHVPVQPQHVPVQPDLEALPQVSSGFGDIDSTVLPPPPPPPPPYIVDINPRCGPHSTSQRVLVLVKNLPRGNGEQYCIQFSHAITVATSFVSPEGDLVQILECMTPITTTSCAWFPSLMRDHDPQTAIASSSVHYTFF